MLFEFGSVWKIVIIFFLTWIMYTVFDYEFTVITLLAGIFAIQCGFIKKNG